MKAFIHTKKNALKTWLAGAIPDLSNNITVSDAGLLLWDAQITHLEKRCEATIRRPFWAGVTAVALFLVFAVFVMGDKNPGEPSQYLTQVLNSRVDPVASPHATITMFESKEARVTVLWTEGLQSLPADYAAK